MLYYTLNEKGIECYNRNQNMKNIQPDHIFIIIEDCGHDSGREIVKVCSEQNNSLKDYYFTDCLSKTFSRKCEF